MAIDRNSKESRAFWKEFDLEPPQFEADLSNMPPVDRPRLLQLVRLELPEPEARATYELISRFEPWAQAHGEIIAAEWKANKKKK